MRVHYFQHAWFEGLGSIEEHFTSRGVRCSKTQFFQEAPKIPRLEDVDFLVVMGGPMSVNDETQFPWLTNEKAFIRDFMTAGKPILGICLGAQLIASAMDARVYRNPEKEIGWFPVHGEAPKRSTLFEFPDEEQVFHWHGETFDLPEGAVRIASSEGCANQAFQLKTNVLGLQFHAEMQPQSVAKILEACRDELALGMYIQLPEDINAKTIKYYKQANLLMERMLDFLVGS